MAKNFEWIDKNQDYIVLGNCHYTMFVSGAKRKAVHKFYESLGYKLDEVQGFKKYLE